MKVTMAISSMGHVVGPNGEIAHLEWSERHETPKTKVELQKKVWKTIFCCFGFYISVLGFTSQHHDISRLLNGQPPRHTHTQTYNIEYGYASEPWRPRFHMLTPPFIMPKISKNHSQPILSFHKPALLTTSGMVSLLYHDLWLKHTAEIMAPTHKRENNLHYPSTKIPTGTFHGEKKPMFV